MDNMNQINMNQMSQPPASPESPQYPQNPAASSQNPAPFALNQPVPPSYPSPPHSSSPYPAADPGFNANTIKRSITEPLYKLCTRQMREFQKTIKTISVFPLVITFILFLGISNGAIEVSGFFQIFFWLIFGAIALLIIAVIGMSITITKSRAALGRLLEKGEVMETEGNAVKVQSSKNIDIWTVGNMRIEAGKEFSKMIEEMSNVSSGRPVRIIWEPVSMQVISINDMEIKGYGIVKSA